MSQNHQHGLQKTSPNGVQKKTTKNNHFSNPECGQSAVNKCKIDDIHVLILTPSWVSFWRCVGSPNGGQSLQKGTSKNIKHMMPKMTPKWSQRGSQNEAKIVKNEVLEASCFQGGSQVASRPPSGSILERFWDHFGTMFVIFFNICLMIFACIVQQHVATKIRSTSQGIIKIMQQRASKKQLLSSCHLTLKSSLANVNELSGPH